VSPQTHAYKVARRHVAQKKKKPELKRAEYEYVRNSASGVYSIDVNDDDDDDDDDDGAIHAGNI